LQGFRRLYFLVIIVVLLFLFAIAPVSLAKENAQLPTVAIPTVTGTPLGAFVTVKRDINQDSINVRAGPNSKYDMIGLLIIGQQAPALGRTPGGDWIQISYPGVPGGVGWVFSPLVDLIGNIPVVEPPPTPTPRMTPTIDPVLASQFIREIPPTRLPTFTPPPPLTLPTYDTGSTNSRLEGFPVGIIIIGMAVIGILGLGISFLSGR
jgi:Bacterial SH3 domain